MTILVREGDRVKECTFQEGETILAVLQREGIRGIHTPCGGNGKCKKCSVNVRSQAFCGTCLACTTKAADGMIVEVSPEVQMTVAENGKCTLLPPTPGQTGYAIACDIGTTTVVCHLLNLATGERMATVSGANAQRIFGADVLARIQACSEGWFQNLIDAIVDQLNGFITSLCEKTKVPMEEVHVMAVAGNTTMAHLYTGLDPTPIGVTPFTPRSYFGEMLDARTIGMCFDGQVYVCPAVAGYVGGDITADALSTNMHNEEKPILMIDIGTNGEMMLGCGNRFVACATAAGPAFEGAFMDKGMAAAAGAVSVIDVVDGKLKLNVIGNVKPVGICGSGLVDAMAVMLDLGAMDETGRLSSVEDAPDEAKPFLARNEKGMIFCLTEDQSVYVSQEDIRKFQLAKAAIAAGVRIMIMEYGIETEDVSKLLLAGGFGSFVRPASAAKIGLIPAELLSVTEAVGNAAGEGAVSAAVSQEARDLLAAITANVKYIELSNHRSFNDEYVDCMMFE